MAFRNDTISSHKCCCELHRSRPPNDSGELLASEIATGERLRLKLMPRAAPLSVTIRFSEAIETGDRAN
jgi:hypothetical protein